MTTTSQLEPVTSAGAFQFTVTNGGTVPVNVYSDNSGANLLGAVAAGASSVFFAYTTIWVSSTSPNRYVTVTPNALSPRSFSSVADVLRNAPVPNGFIYAWADPNNNSSYSGDPHYLEDHILTQFAPGLYMDFTFHDGLGTGVKWLTGQAISKIMTRINVSSATLTGSWAGYSPGSILWVRGNGASQGTCQSSATANSTCTFSSVYGTDLALEMVVRTSGGGFAIVTVDGAPCPGLPTVTATQIAAGWFTAAQLGASYINCFANQNPNGALPVYLGQFAEGNHTVVITVTGTYSSDGGNNTNAQVQIGGLYVGKPGLQPGPNTWPVPIAPLNDWWGYGSECVDAIDCSPHGTAQFTYIGGVHGYEGIVSSSITLDGSAYTRVPLTNGGWQSAHDEFRWIYTTAMVHPNQAATTVSATVTASTTVPVASGAVFTQNPDGNWGYLVLETGTAYNATRTPLAIASVSGNTVTLAAAATIASGATARPAVAVTTRDLTFRADRPGVLWADVYPTWFKAMDMGSPYIGMLPLALKNWAYPPTNQYAYQPTFFDSAALGSSGWIPNTQAQLPAYNGSTIVDNFGPTTWMIAKSSKSWLSNVVIGIAFVSQFDNFRNFTFNSLGCNIQYRIDGSSKLYCSMSLEGTPYAISPGDTTNAAFNYCAFQDANQAAVTNLLVAAGLPGA